MSDDATGRRPASTSGQPSAGLEALTEEVLPALIARLRASRLGELEISTATWRVRLRRDASVRPAHGPASSSLSEAAAAAVDGSLARSPAVGYFTPAPDLALGQTVVAGDLLGNIDVLGIAQEVVAPADGIISRLLVEDGQAVEYGQALAEIDPLEPPVPDALPEEQGR